MKPRWHRRLAHRLGYDIEKFNKQMTLESHLRDVLGRQEIDLVLDVGANVGQYAQTLRRLGYRGDIISFEPARATFDNLSGRTAADPRWRAEHMALGHETGKATLNLSGANVFNSLHASSEAGTQTFGANLAATATEEVAVARLDEYLDAHVPDFTGRRVHLKMDTQGHDARVFEGAGRYRSRFASLQSEISVVPIYEDVPDYIEMLQTYRGFGYEVSGLYTIHRRRSTGHVIEFDCLMLPLDR